MAVFKEEDDYLRYLDLIGKYKDFHLFDLYHYCLMPNHTHFLTRTKSAKDFAIFMKKLNLAYFAYFKKKYRWDGHLWQGRYKSQPVGKDEYLMQAGKYIELNPVRARLVEKPEDYIFSSHRHYALGEVNPLLTDDIFYEELAGNDAARRAKYKELVVADEITQTYLASVWGSYPQRRNERRKMGYHRGR